MHISCPQCHFKRSVNGKQIPASATIATCPKCENKFRFRDPETGDLIDEICSNFEDINPNGSTNPADTGSSNEDLGEDSATRGTRLKEKAATDVEGDIEDDVEGSGESTRTHEKNIQEFTEKNVQDTEDKNNSQTDKLTSTEDQPQKDINENFDSYQNSIDSEDPKPLREEEITQRHDEEDRDNPLRHPQESSHNQPKTGGNEKYQMVTDDVPWEHPERYGIIGSLVQTISRVMFRAPEFFSTIHSQSSALRPATFYALLGLFQTLCLQIWFSTFDMGLFVDHPHLQKSVSSFSTPMTIIMSPFVSVFYLLLFSAFLYLAIRITNPEHADYNLILRIVAYANAPMILVIVPFIGPLIGLVWFVVNIFIGVKYALRLTWQRAVLALSPIFLLWIFWFVLAVSSLSQSIG